MIAPPYSSEFIAAMLPIAKNKEITAPLKVSDGGDDVTEFLGNYGCLHSLGASESTKI